MTGNKVVTFVCSHKEWMKKGHIRYPSKYAEVLFRFELKFLPRDSTGRLNLQIDLGSLHLSSGKNDLK